MKRYDKWKLIQNYVIIAAISLVSLFFLPMIGSQAGLQWNIPNTVVGWVVFVVSKLLVAGINILIFHCFVQQGKVNVQDDQRYIQANSILVKADVQEQQFVSPQQYMHDIYGKKSVTIFVTTVLSTIGLTQAVLTFDWISMLTYFFTILGGIIFGVIQMNDVQNFWTYRYWRYAKKIQKDMAEAQKKLLEQEHAASNDNSIGDILEPGDSNSDSGSDNRPLVADDQCSDNSLLVPTNDTGCADTAVADNGVQKDNHQDIA